MKVKVNTEFLSLDFFHALKKSTRNSQGLIRLSNNSVSRAMYKERKQFLRTSLDSIAIFARKFFGLDKSQYFPRKIITWNAEGIPRLKEGDIGIFGIAVLAIFTGLPMANQSRSALISSFFTGLPYGKPSRKIGRFPFFFFYWVAYGKPVGKWVDYYFFFYFPCR